MRKSVLALALIAFAAPQIAFTGTALPQTRGGKSSGSAVTGGTASGGVYEQLNLFGEAFERIRNDAVEPVGDSKLVRHRDLRHAVRSRSALGVSDRGRIQGAAVERAGGHRRDRARADDGQTVSPRSCRRATDRPRPPPISSPAT